MSGIDELSAAIGSMLNEALGQGWKFPIFLTAIGSNGSMIGARYSRGADGIVQCEFLCENMPEEGIKTPVNLMFTDGAEKALRVLISKSGSKPKLCWVN